MNEVSLFCQEFVAKHPADAARVLDGLPPSDVANLCGALEPAAFAPVFEQMIPSVAADCLAGMCPATAAHVVEELRADVAASLLRRLDPEAKEAVLERLEPGVAEPLKVLLRHREGTAGALLDPQALTLAEDETAGRALARIRRAPRHMLYYLYVLDRDRRLVGVLDLQELMLCSPRESISAVMHRPVAHLRADAERAMILSHRGWQLFHALPVVDAGSIFLGAIRYQTFRRLEDTVRNAARHQSQGAATTAFALSELYWMSLSGLFRGLLSPEHTTISIGSTGSRREP